MFKEKAIIEMAKEAIENKIPMGIDTIADKLGVDTDMVAGVLSKAGIELPEADEGAEDGSEGDSEESDDASDDSDDG